MDNRSSKQPYQGFPSVHQGNQIVKPIAKQSDDKSQGFPLLVKNPVAKTVLMSSYKNPTQAVRPIKDADHILDDNMGDLNIVDTRKYMSKVADFQDDVIIEDIPNKITGTYNDDYNIIYIDEIIKKKLRQEKFTYLYGLKLQHKALENTSCQPQTYVAREGTLESMKKLQEEITNIESGDKLRNYDASVKDIISEYRKYNGMVKTIIFDIKDDDHFEEMDDNFRNRIHLIEKYLEIASNYIQLDIIRINNRPSDICTGCGASLAKVIPSEEGTLRCPEVNCQTEHNVITLSKLSKDGSRININPAGEDESVENFIRTFMKYQGLQHERPPDSLYEELDKYFIGLDKMSGVEVRALPLTNRGRRGDTDHKMLWIALSAIGYSEYYEDTNLIGHIYWGWTLPSVMQYKEIIIAHYNKTQKVYYQIPVEERGRNSSLGTHYRLWRHLQLVGHECYADEFKLSVNEQSALTHSRLWRMMCEGANDPDIFYIS